MKYLASAVLAVLPLSLASLGNAGETNVDLAREAIAQGDAAFAAEDYEAAREAFRTAWKLKESYSIACKLGRVEALLGEDHPTAARYLSYCMDHFTDTSEEVALEARFRELRDQERSQVLIVSLAVTPASAHLLVDGELVGEAGSHPELFLEPGPHEVIVRTREGEEQRFPVEGIGGETKKLRAQLARGAEAPPPSESAEPSAPPSVILWLGGGLTAAALGVGVGFHLSAAGSADDAESLRGSLASQGLSCSGSQPSSECAALAEAVDDQNSASRIATIGYASAGVFALGTAVTWWLWPRETPATSAPATAVHLTQLPGGAYLSFDGSF